MTTNRPSGTAAVQGLSPGPVAVHLQLVGLLRTYASFVRFSHSVFALPFALVGALLAAADRAGRRGAASSGSSSAMVTARSAAMGFNRLVDARFDALNPRTAPRELPRGRDVVDARRRVLVAIASVAFVVCAWQLGTAVLGARRRSRSPSCSGTRSPSASRATRSSFLGLAMAVAPVGGWIAAGGPVRRRSRGCSGSRSARGSAASTCSTPARISTSIGRDGLRSIPVRFGVPRSLPISRVLHVVTVLPRRARRRRRARPGLRGRRRRWSARCWSTNSRS